MTRTVTLAGYAVVVVAAVAVEVSARWAGRGARLADVLSALLERRSVRVALQVGWLWLGWHVFVRVDWR